MRIALGADEAGLELKNEIKKFLEDLKIDVEDYGVYTKQPCLYPDIAVKVAEAIRQGRAERGILVCGTGIGMAMVANKVPGIRAAVCHDIYSAERSRKSNDAQIMAVGARVIGHELAKSLVEVWLKSEFEGGRSTPKVEKISEYESKYYNLPSANNR